jgi:hypothetical protein
LIPLTKQNNNNNNKKKKKKKKPLNLEYKINVFTIFGPLPLLAFNYSYYTRVWSFQSNKNEKSD